LNVVAGVTTVQSLDKVTGSAATSTDRRPLQSCGLLLPTWAAAEDEGMEEQPEIVSFGRPDDGRRPPRRSDRPWPWFWLIIVACLIVVIVQLATTTTRRDATISQLQSRLRAAAGSHAGPVLAAQGAVATAVHSFPDGEHGSFSMFVVAVGGRPGAAPSLVLYVQGRATPGQRYGLQGGQCRGQYVTPTYWTEATADSRGNLTIVGQQVPGLPTDQDLYVLVSALENGATLGGIMGPLTGTGAIPFRTIPPC
jgi:hypothetical protein